MTPFEIVTENDVRIASNGAVQITIMEPELNAFRRRAVCNVGTQNATQAEWFVVEIGDVKVYFDGISVLVSRRDIYP
jgi:hypothetical protein